MSVTYPHLSMKGRWSGNNGNPYAPLDKIKELEAEIVKKNERIKQLEDEVFELTVLTEKKGKPNG